MNTLESGWKLESPGPKPKKPNKPRAPKEFVIRTEQVWNSEDESVQLAELLNQIPADVPADRIHISVEKNKNGYRFTTISYDYEVPNTKYQKQLDAYNLRLEKYQHDLEEWETELLEWTKQNKQYNDFVLSIDELVSSSFNRVA